MPEAGKTLPAAKRSLPTAPITHPRKRRTPGGGITYDDPNDNPNDHPHDGVWKSKILRGPPPAVTATATPSPAAAGSTILFQGFVIIRDWDIKRTWLERGGHEYYVNYTEIPGDITGKYWYLGTERIGSGTAVTHTFPEPGVHAVTFRVTANHTDHEESASAGGVEVEVIHVEVKITGVVDFPVDEHIIQLHLAVLGTVTSVGGILTCSARTGEPGVVPSKIERRAEVLPEDWIMDLGTFTAEGAITMIGVRFFIIAHYQKGEIYHIDRYVHDVSVW